MKNLILLLIGAMLMLVASCVDNSDTVEISKEEYKQLKGDTIKPKYPKPFELYTDGLDYRNRNEGIVLGSDQHEYLVTNFNNNSQNVEHYIDCELCQKRIENPSLKIKWSSNEQDKPLSLLGGESMAYEASAYYRLTKNGMKKLELRLVLIQDVIFGCSYQLRYVEID